MAVNENRYKEIMDKIYGVVFHYTARYNKRPNTVIMRKKDYDDLKETNEFMIYAPQVPTEEITLMGMKIQIADTDKISVGYMVDID